MFMDESPDLGKYDMQKLLEQMTEMLQPLLGTATEASMCICDCPEENDLLDEMLESRRRYWESKSGESLDSTD